jgi:hypothetical protein
MKSGSGWFCSEVGGAQPGSVGAEGFEGGEGGAEFICGKAQLLPRRRTKIIRGINKYFTFSFFIIFITIASFYRQNIKFPLISLFCHSSTQAELGQRVFVTFWLPCQDEICYSLTQF